LKLERNGWNEDPPGSLEEWYAFISKNLKCTDMSSKAFDTFERPFLQVEYYNYNFYNQKFVH
jgi:hypothetical protein